MSAPKHTPEPWVVAIDSTCSGAWFEIRQLGDEDGRIARTNTFAVVSDLNGSLAETYEENPAAFEELPDAAETRADAYLLAAAPELLAALKCCLTFDCKRTGSRGRVLALAAIAKAEGREP